MRLITENVSNVQWTDEDKRRCAEGTDNLRVALAGVIKEATNEGLKRVVELEEGWKKLEEEVRTRSMEDVMRCFEEECDEEVTREGSCEIYGKGKGNGNGGKEEHASRKVKFREKGAAKIVNGDDEGEEADEEKEGTRKPRWADCEEEEEEARQGAAEGERHKARKEQGIMWLDDSDEEQEGQEGSAGGERREA